MNIKLISIIIPSLLMSVSAYSDEEVKSNFVEGDYVADTCIEPPSPPMSFDMENAHEDDIVQYGKEITKYNTKRDVFFDCIEIYMANINSDIKNVTQKALTANKKLKRQLDVKLENK